MFDKYNGQHFNSTDHTTSANTSGGGCRRRCDDALCMCVCACAWVRIGFLTEGDNDKCKSISSIVSRSSSTHAYQNARVLLG